jgi:hypothetical protein
VANFSSPWMPDGSPWASKVSFCWSNGSALEQKGDERAVPGGNLLRVDRNAGHTRMRLRLLQHLVGGRGGSIYFPPAGHMQSERCQVRLFPANGGALVGQEATGSVLSVRNIDPANCLMSHS